MDSVSDSIVVIVIPKAVYDTLKEISSTFTDLIWGKTGAEGCGIVFDSLMVDSSLVGSVWDFGKL